MWTSCYNKTKMIFIGRYGHLVLKRDQGYLKNTFAFFSLERHVVVSSNEPKNLTSKCSPACTPMRSLSLIPFLDPSTSSMRTIFLITEREQ